MAKAPATSLSPNLQPNHFSTSRLDVERIQALKDVFHESSGRLEA